MHLEVDRLRFIFLISVLCSFGSSYQGGGGSYNDKLSMGLASTQGGGSTAHRAAFSCLRAMFRNGNGVGLGQVTPIPFPSRS